MAQRWPRHGELEVSLTAEGYLNMPICSRHDIINIAIDHTSFGDNNRTPAILGCLITLFLLASVIK